MIILLSIALTFFAAGAAALAHAVRHAPEGLETEEGFTAVPVAARSPRRRRRAALLHTRQALSS